MLPERFLVRIRRALFLPSLAVVNAVDRRSKDRDSALHERIKHLERLMSRREDSDNALSVARTRLDAGSLK